MNMNQADIEYAAQQCEGHPVLGPATKFLLLLLEAVNSQSDGWAYWRPPGEASKKLQEFIRQNTNYGFMPNANARNVTIADFKKTIPPIRAMVTRQVKKQAQYGNRFSFDVDWALARCMDKPQPKPEPHRGVTEFKIWRISSNTNSFGHHQFYLTSKTGETWKVCRHQTGTGRDPWKMYEVVSVPFVGGDYNWASLGVEVPERLDPDAPKEVVDQIWEERIHQPQVTA